jgi:hypothetical protein
MVQRIVCCLWSFIICCGLAIFGILCFSLAHAPAAYSETMCQGPCSLPAFFSQLVSWVHTVPGYVYTAGLYELGKGRSHKDRDTANLAESSY